MDKPQPKRKKKLNKLEREKRRAERADVFNSGFQLGYTAGYSQALQDLKKEGDSNQCLN